MSVITSMPRRVAIAINDLVDSCAEIKSGQQVLIVAASDGLTGGVNVVDEAAIAWIQAAVQQRGAFASVLWTDIPSPIHAWRVPPVVKAAVEGIDVMISHAFDLPFEELYELRGADWCQTCLSLITFVRERRCRVTRPRFYANADSASRTSIFATLVPSLIPAAATAAWNSLFFASSSALSL